MATQQPLTAQPPAPQTNESFFSWLGKVFPGPARFLQEEALPAVGRFIEGPLGLPLRAADEAVQFAIRRPIATAAGSLQSLRSGQGLDVRNIWNQTSRELYPGVSLTPGQAVTTLLGQTAISRNPIIGGLLRATDLDDDLYRYVPYLNPEFDITDKKERRQSYLDSFYGSLTTGLSDIALELLGAKGTGSILKAGRVKSGLQRIPDAPTERAIIRGTNDARQAYIDQGSPLPGQYRSPNGEGVWIMDIVEKTNPAELLNNPFISRSPHLSELAAKITDFDTAAAFAMLVRGNPDAALAMSRAKPALFDSAMTEIKKQTLDPGMTDDLAGALLGTLPAPASSARVNAITRIFDDLVKDDPALKAQVEDLAISSARGEALNPTWAPSKFAGIEKVRKGVADSRGIRYSAATADAISETIAGGGLFRPIRVLHAKGLNFKQLGIVSLTGPFRKDAYDEISAMIADSRDLRRLEKNPETRPLIKELREKSFRRLNLALDESTRRQALKDFEADAIALIARERAKVNGVQGNVNVENLVAAVQGKRDGVVDQGSRGNIITDEYDIDIRIDDNLKSKLPDSFVMLDLNQAARMIDVELKPFKTVNDGLDKIGANVPDQIKLGFESLNSIFSAAVLIRPGYIPKNSIFEPAARYFMETGNLFDMQLFFPAVTNAARNAVSTTGALTERFAQVYFPGKRKATARIREQRSKLIAEKRDLYNNQYKEVDNRIKEIVQERRQIKRDARRKKMDKGDADMRLAMLKDELEIIQPVKKFTQDQLLLMDAAISELSGKLPRALAAARKGEKLSILDRPQPLLLSNGKIVTFNSLKKDGGNSYIQELGDATVSLYNASGLSFVNRKQMSLGSYRPPTPGTKEYFTKLEVEIQRFSKADPAGRALLEGKTVEEVAKIYWQGWKDLGAKSPLYRLIVGSRTKQFRDGSPSIDDIEVTYKQAQFYAQEANTFMRLHIPDPDMRAQALTRRITAKELAERAEGQADLLPQLEEVFYPADAGMFAKIINGYIGASRKAFQALVLPEVKLFRYQLADRAYREGLKIMGDKIIEAGGELTPAVMRQIEDSAKRYAVEKITSTFYQVRRMNNYQYYSRFLLGFPTAMYNSLKFYGIAGFLNPYYYALLEQLRTTPWAVGTVVNNEGVMVNEKGFLIDENGNYVNEIGQKTTSPVRNQGESFLLLPSYQQIWDRVAGKEGTKPEISAYSRKLNTRQFNYLVGGPGLVWFGSLGLNKTIASFPSLETTLKNALGERGYGNLVFEGRVGLGFGTPAEEAGQVLSQLTPDWLEETTRLAAAGKDELLSVENNALQYKTGKVATTMNLIHNARLLNQKMTNPESTEEPDIDTTTQATFGFLGQRLMERIFSPLGITYQPRSQMYQDKLNQYEQYYITYPDQAGGMTAKEAAMFKLIADNGDDVLSTMGFLTGSRERQVSLDYTQEVAGNLIKFNDSGLLQKAIGGNSKRLKAIPIILEPTVPGEFSPAAYSFINAFNKSGVNLRGVPRDFADMKTEAGIRAGWYEYTKLNNRIDAQLAGRRSKDINANEDLLQYKRTAVDELRKLYPAWYEEWGGSQAVPNFKSNMAVIETALEDDDFMNNLTGPDRDKWNYIEAWYEEYQGLAPTYLTSTDRTFRRNIRDYWAQRTNQLIMSNTYFADFHSRWLTGDQIIDESALIKAATPAAPPNPVQSQPTTPGDSVATIVEGVQQRRLNGQP